MRPTLNVISPELCARVVAEAKRVLAESGMEIRGPALRERLLDEGLKTSGDGTRILFPADVVERALATAPKSFTLYDRDGRDGLSQQGGLLRGRRAAHRRRVRRLGRGRRAILT